jgi:signal transduction histidine kinase
MSAGNEGAEHEPAADELAAALATHLRDAREDLVRRWLDRIVARVSVDPSKVFPTAELLNHVPILIDGIADLLERPDLALDEKVPLVPKAMELGALRHTQGFDAYEILKEQELLGAIILNYLADIADSVDVRASRRDVLECWQRVAHALELIRQATTGHFLRLAGDRVREREERLRRFNRMVAHELKNRVGAIRGASGLLTESWVDESQKQRFQRMIGENADGLQHVLENLEALSRVDSDARQRHNILLPQAAAEAARQLRDAAHAREVCIEVADDLPSVEVDAAAVELCLMNYVSNAIKYCDAGKAAKWVRIKGELRFGAGTSTGNDGELVVEVRDNGIGVPADARDDLFEQFYRVAGETVTTIEGTGLGLSIVKDTIESLGGRAWAEFPEEGGSVFYFSLPSRREEDAAAAGTARPGDPVPG